MCSHDVRIWALFQMILDTLNKPRRFVFCGLHSKSCIADLAGLWADHLTLKQLFLLQTPVVWAAPCNLSFYASSQFCLSVIIYLRPVQDTLPKWYLCRIDLKYREEVRCFCRISLKRLSLSEIGQTLFAKTLRRADSKQYKSVPPDSSASSFDGGVEGDQI